MNKIYIVFALPLWILIEIIYRLKYGLKWWEFFDEYEPNNYSLGFIVKRGCWDILVNEDSFWGNLKWRLRERFDLNFRNKNIALKKEVEQLLSVRGR